MRETFSSKLKINREDSEFTITDQILLNSSQTSRNISSGTYIARQERAASLQGAYANMTTMMQRDQPPRGSSSLLFARSAPLLQCCLPAWLRRACCCWKRGKEVNMKHVHSAHKSYHLQLAHAWQKLPLRLHPLRQVPPAHVPHQQARRNNFDKISRYFVSETPLNPHEVVALSLRLLWTEAQPQHLATAWKGMPKPDRSLEMTRWPWWTI